jgi:hypothetical protein
VLVDQVLLMHGVMMDLLLYLLRLPRQEAAVGVVMLAQGQEKMEVQEVVRLTQPREQELQIKVTLEETEKVITPVI